VAGDREDLREEGREGGREGLREGKEEETHLSVGVLLATARRGREGERDVPGGGSRGRRCVESQ